MGAGNPGKHLFSMFEKCLKPLIVIALLVGKKALIIILNNLLRKT